MSSIEEGICFASDKYVASRLVDESDPKKRDETLVEGLAMLHEACMGIIELPPNYIGADWKLRPYLIKKDTDYRHTYAPRGKIWSMPWHGVPGDTRENVGFLLRLGTNDGDADCFIQCLCQQEDKEAVLNEAFWHSKILRLILNSAEEEGNTSMALGALTELEREAFHQLAQDYPMITQVTTFPAIDFSRENAEADVTPSVAIGDASAELLEKAKQLGWGIKEEPDHFLLMPPVEDTYCDVTLCKVTSRRHALRMVYNADIGG